METGLWGFNRFCVSIVCEHWEEEGEASLLLSAHKLTKIRGARKKAAWATHRPFSTTRNTMKNKAAFILFIYTDYKIIVLV